MAFDPQLGQLFQFDHEELAANREGRLTPGQKLLFANTAKITKRQLKRSRTIMPMILIAVIVLVIFAQSRTAGAVTSSLIVPAAILAWIAAIVIFFMRRGTRHQQAYAKPKLLSVEGEVEFSPTSSSLGTWHATFGGVTFVVESLATERMREGARSRVYYLEQGFGKPGPLSLERV